MAATRFVSWWASTRLLILRVVSGNSLAFRPKICRRVDRKVIKKAFSGWLGSIFALFEPIFKHWLVFYSEFCNRQTGVIELHDVGS